MKITVVLYDEDGVSQHASGKVEFDKIEEHHLLERDGQLYGFHRMDGMTGHFRKSKAAYKITEF